MEADPVEHIAWFAQIGLSDRPRVGGKGASLGELERAQVRVPPGFVVTTEAFRDFVLACDPESTLRDALAAAGAAGDEAAAPATALRTRLETAALPAGLEAELARAYDRLCADAANDLPVAVRSSATGEDSVGASFAGLQDTYLWVRGFEDVLAALRRCWASLYSDPAVSYRRRLGLHEDDMAMGVVVQRMVEPRSAGVMFTRSPLTGDRSVVAISASWGLGSAVVGGEVTPDEFVINKVTGSVARTISCKELRHVPSPAGSGVREEPVPEELQRRAALEESELAALTNIARRIETHYGAPQDIEWALDAQGTIFVLQSRPETVWSAKDREAAAKSAAANAAGSAPQTKPFEHVFSFFGTPKK